MEPKLYNIGDRPLLVYNNRIWIEADGLEIGNVESEPSSPAKRKYRKKKKATVHRKHGKRGKNIGPEVMELIEKELKDKTKTTAEIAEEYEISTATVNRIKNALKIKDAMGVSDKQQTVKCNFCGESFRTTVKGGKIDCPECGEENQV